MSSGLAGDADGTARLSRSRSRQASAGIRRLGAACRLAGEAAPAHLMLFLGLSAAAGGLPVVLAWLTKMVIDGLATGAAHSTLAAGLAVAGVVAGVSPQLMQYLQAQMDRQVGLLTQDRLFTAVDSFVGLGRFENPDFLDRLRLAQQTGSMAPQQAISGVLGVFQGMITVSGFLASLFLLSPLMMVLVLTGGVPTLVAEIFLARRRASIHWSLGPVERRELLYSRLLSEVAAAKEIRLFGIGGYLRSRMLAERRTANVARQRLDRRELVTQAGLGLVAAAVSGGGLLWAVSAAHAGQLSAGDITVFLAAVAGVQGVLATLAGQVAQTHEALLLFEHYRAVTTAGPDLRVASSPRTVRPLKHGIELDDVWFRYTDDHPWVLRGVTLTIPTGRSVGLVGVNGAGKSTLVKLLCRFYDPTSGAIRWDGVDIRELDPTDLRRRIGAVFQDYMCYDMTARENIALGQLEAVDDADRIYAAAQRAGVHQALLRLPRGYDTLLSRTFLMESEKDNPESGVVLSGGQWQRLALARAFLRDRPDLMILDEPSAGLDAEAEYEIHTALQQHRRGRTTLLISHRLGAVRDADVIVVLADGRVLEKGDHATLLAAGGVYARLFNLQASGYQMA